MCVFTLDTVRLRSITVPVIQSSPEKIRRTSLCCMADAWRINLAQNQSCTTEIWQLIILNRYADNNGSTHHFQKRPLVSKNTLNELPFENLFGNNVVIIGRSTKISKMRRIWRKSGFTPSLCTSKPQWRVNHHLFSCEIVVLPHIFFLLIEMWSKHQKYAL